MIIIPVFQDRSARYSFDIELNGTVFHLVFNWNSREESWYMNIQNAEEVDILDGVKLVPSYSLLKQYKAYENLPKGEFILWDIEQNPAGSNVTFDNYGKRYQLLFFTDEEILAGEVA